MESLIVAGNWVNLAAEELHKTLLPTTDLDWESIVVAFHKKMRFKNLEFTGIEQLINPKSDKALKGAWKNSLGHQIQQDKLPDYEIVRANLLDLFEIIFNQKRE